LIKYFDPSPPDPSKSSLPIGIGISLQEELKHQVNHLPVGKKIMGVSFKIMDISQNGGFHGI